ncbi:sulfatase family protein [Tuwongella immobilis]|uniref:Sulfatase N-terminal domain-containing protein n=1 Tax=Tuwongella immobilis TaxID=692036 RepID=A0A6C2YNA4_9BACT|nr:sulfatase [Tuwongella immobilis]VIP02857.1 arylsulfatase : Steryl-sulfatase OS=Chthoniobacter flavus Ellin428 GN=CfE428DRAFT_4754 PE=4 SV=1: Sulfatase: Sulfatase_C [Tuwongella immobilis]VTS02659.1 arylsulfatase : Steryl-sulfatase OS=Chthoniobacter flavus Ellin428 GN=CfE428DRAFT_4754 PE=4 SV=1: Sulfatase: Sulfatase_C [Tuwongella immobilis]
MNRFVFLNLFRVAGIYSLIFLSSAPVNANEPPPNFVIITIDDLGYADIGAFGSEKNRTPNCDRMAKEGCKFTSFYAAPVCSPSRAALMTGCYPKRVLPIPGVLFPTNPIGLSPSEITIAELVKPKGYHTASIGKWHIGDQPEFLPNQQGFDYSFGLPYSNDMGPVADGTRSDLGKPIPQEKGTNRQPPLSLLRNGKVIQRIFANDQQTLVELYTNEAVEWITKNQQNPFLLYLPHNAVHFPIYPGKKWAGKSPHGIFSDWVEEVDWSVGVILETLKKLKLDQRTYVIFTSDNGGTARSVNTPLRGFKASTFEGGIRVPMIAWCPGKIPAGSQSSVICGMMDLFPTIADLAGIPMPDARKRDGVSLRAQLHGTANAPAPRETFYYFRGLQLEGVRNGKWKLHFPSMNPSMKNVTRKLYDLEADPGESRDRLNDFPEIVKKLDQLIQVTDQDLGVQGIGPGCRELGRVPMGKPLIDFNGNIRPEVKP